MNCFPSPGESHCSPRSASTRGCVNLYSQECPRLPENRLRIWNRYKILPPPLLNSCPHQCLPPTLLGTRNTSLLPPPWQPIPALVEQSQHTLTLPRACGSVGRPMCMHALLGLPLWHFCDTPGPAQGTCKAQTGLWIVP